jgi:hypothetical protein
LANSPISSGKFGKLSRDILDPVRPQAESHGVRGTVQGMLVPWLENSQETSQKLGINNLKHLVS